MKWPENEVARKKSVEKQTTENATKKIKSNTPNNNEMTKLVKKAKPMSIAGVDGTDSVDRKYKNISVGVKNMGVGVDYYLSPTLVFSAGMMRSEYEDFGITLDPAGSANLLAKEMKIDSINLGFKKYF